jgi:hypothetical protein
MRLKRVKRVSYLPEIERKRSNEVSEIHALLDVIKLIEMKELELKRRKQASVKNN